MSAKDEFFEPAPEPSHLAYTTNILGDGHAPQYFEVGTAHTHKDGKGCEVRLHAPLIDGRLIIRPIGESLA